MSIGIFHNLSDWANTNIAKNIRKKGVPVDFININDYVFDLHDKRKFKHALYFNRVYSISSLMPYNVTTYEKDNNTARAMVEVLKHIHNLGIRTVQPIEAAYIEYSKTEGNNMMEKNGILTPKTMLVVNKKTAMNVAKKIEFPVVVKIDLGGGSVGVHKVDNLKQYTSVVSALSKDHHLIHIEEFIEPKAFITRAFVLNHTLVGAYKSYIIEGWKGNSLEGSRIEPYKSIPPAVKKTVENASQKMQCAIAGMDVLETKKGIYIVDINPIPSFQKEDLEIWGFDPTEKIAEYICDTYTKLSHKT